MEFEGSEEHGTRRLVIATYDPFNLAGRQAAVQAVDLPIVWRMASRRRVHDALRRLYGVGADTFEKILEGRDLDYENLEMKDEASVIDEDEDEEASVVKFVNQIIREALEQRATDIHVEPLADNLRIRYRVDGVLVDIAVPENIKALQSSVIARLKIMSRLDIAERRLPQDGRINLSFEGKAIDVRVATVPTVEGESVSLRLLNQQRFNVEMLSMEESIQEKIEAPAQAVQRDHPGHRPDRFRKVDESLFVPERSERAGDAHRDDRGSGREQARWRDADRGEVGDRAHLCERPALDPAGRSRHRDDR